MAGKTVKVKVLRSFFGVGQKIHHAGAVVELPEVVANEVIAGNKAELSDEAPREGKPRESHGQQAKAAQIAEAKAAAKKE